MNIKKRRLGKWLLLAVLLYCLLTAVILQFTDSHLILYFCPYSVLFNSSFLAPCFGWLMYVFALPPLAGWLLLLWGKSPEKLLVSVPFVVLIALNVLITAMYLILSLGSWSPGLLQHSLLTGFVSLLASVPALVMLHLWKPKI